MAPNKKKKKVASNPARGFATTSQPSKSLRVQNMPDKTGDVAVNSEDGVSAGSQTQTSHAVHDSTVPNLQGLSPDELEAHLEDAELQTLIESSSVGCKQDALRQVSKLENERRQLRSQAHKLSSVSLLSDDFINQILRQRREVQSDLFHDSRQVPNDDTNLLLKIWTLKTVLTSLRFSGVEAAIEQVIQVAARRKLATSVDYIWGLHEALEWYAIDNQGKDLPDYDNLNGIATQSAIEAIEDSDSGIVTDTPTDTATNTAPNTPQTRPASPTTQTLQEPSDPYSNQEDIKALPTISPSDSEDDDPSTLTSKYIKMQILLFHTELRINRMTQKTPQYQERKQRLQMRIERIRRDVLFDEMSADAAWQADLRQLKIDTARSAKSEKIKPEPLKITKEAISSAEEDEDFLGDMFNMAEDDPDSHGELGEQAVVHIVNFGKWTGITPRRLMEESSRNLDEHCGIRFHNLATTSYLSRQRIELRWTTNHKIDGHALSSLPKSLKAVVTLRSLSIDMVSIAADNLSQSESYLSTVVLFLLVQSRHADNRQVNRLPGVWRDVCSDLTRAHQLLIDAADKESLKDLRRVIQNVRQRLNTNQRSSVNVLEKSTNVPINPEYKAREATHFSADEAKAHWNSRVASPAYRSMLELRRQLPVYLYKAKILQTINEAQLVIICADTGAGKSTQVPSFILEHELAHGQDCRILVTQPRRISAISLARRVSQELGEHKNDLGTERSLIGYAIRLESKTSTTTRITFATTGVLLRMIEASPQLDNLDYLILDEIHERTMDIDLLFIALRRLQQRRAGLKIILMSATVDAQKFSSYFGGAPVLNLPGRTFPVEVRFLEDAIEDTLDINLRTGAAQTHMDEDYQSDEEDKYEKGLLEIERYSDKTRSILGRMDERRIDFELTASLAEAIATKAQYVQYSSAILIFMPGIAEIRQMQNALVGRNVFTSNWVIHLLHSSFSTEDLERAFSIPPQGYRKIVIATNIAETGITIPDVTTVIDTCKEKIMRFNERRQLSRLTEGFISRSSARQRRGRAARVQEGLCFHLVTKHRFNSLMLEQHVPEMMRLSLQDPILRIKIWDLGSIEEILAAAIDPPTSKNVRRAIDKLKDAGALNAAEQLTPLGKIIAKLPLEVVLSKLAIFGIVFRCLDSILTIVAALSSKSPFLPNKNGNEANARFAFARAESDLVSTLNAYQGWRKAKATRTAHQYCKKHHLSDQNLSSIEDQKIQLLVYLVDAGLLEFKHEEKVALSRSRLSSYHGSFFKLPDRYNTYDSDSLLSCVIAMAFYPKILVREGKGWRNIFTNQQVSLTPNSIVRSSDKPPKWLCFYEAMQARSGSLNVLETSKIPEIVIATLLGNAEVRFFSGVIGLDNGRMRFSVKRWIELAAIKTLRETLAAILDRCWRASGLRLSHPDQKWIELFANLVSGRDVQAR